MWRFADRCRQKACEHGYAYHCELRENFNMLITKKFICSISTKQLDDYSVVLTGQPVIGFKRQLKAVLDSALKIFPLLTCQFNDLLMRFQHWESTNAITLATLSKICDHLHTVVRASEVHVQINRVGFDPFVTRPVCDVKDTSQPEKSN